MKLVVIVDAAGVLDVAKEATFTAQLLKDTTTTVLFFYQNGSKLQGSNVNSHFSELIIE